MIQGVKSLAFLEAATGGSKRVRVGNADITGRHVEYIINDAVVAVEVT